MKVKRQNTRAARIEMMPIIDIVFLLLVFFIYAMLSMAVHKGLSLDLPESSTAVQTTKEEPLSLFVRKNNGEMEIRLNGEVLTAAKLTRQLLTLAGTEKPAVLLFAEKDISYQQLYRILDILKMAEFTTVSLQAEAE